MIGDEKTKALEEYYQKNFKEVADVDAATAILIVGRQEGFLQGWSDAMRKAEEKKVCQIRKYNPHGIHTCNFNDYDYAIPLADIKRLRGEKK